MESNSSLDKAFDAKDFHDTGLSLVEFLTRIFENADKRLVLPYQTPEEQYEYWKKDFQEKGSPINLFKDVVDKSLLLHHPHFMGYQTAVPALPTVLASLVIDFLSNGMGVYDAGMVGNTMERVVCEHLCEKFAMGKNAGGFVTSGGTLGTLTAILTAKAHYLKDMDESQSDKLSILTSEQSHYCVERAAITMGISKDRVIKIPVDENYRIRVDELKDSYQKALSEGKRVFCIIANAPSTNTGTYDELEEIGKFCQLKKVWFHVDGAHGAPAIFSEKYKYLLKGTEYADSIVLDFHKMMLTPVISSAVLLKNRSYVVNTFRQKADYLWENQDFEWYEGGKSTFECTKSMTILKVYTLFKQFEDTIFEEFVDYQYDLTREFARLIDENPLFEIAHQPDSNILCFRYIDCNNPNQVNEELRQRLTMDGNFFIVKTILNGNFYLRVTLLNPRTTITHIENLLQSITIIAKNLG